MLRELGRMLPVLGLPETAAEAYGTIRAELERKGQMIGNNDLWIAAHAKAAGLVLVTNNEREFRRVRGVEGENWAVGGKSGRAGDVPPLRCWGLAFRFLPRPCGRG